MDLQRALAAAKARLSGFTTGQIVIIGLLAVVGLVAVGAFLRWVTTPSYDVLLAGLDPADAAAVTEQLDSSGVPYQLAAGGGTVLVPASQLQAQRLAVAAAGLPEGQAKGFELLDEQGMTASSFQQRVAYERALEGELARTLKGMDSVRGATVHLALPEEELYTDEQKPAQASVLLDTAGSFPRDRVDAVQRLVASAVPGLEPAAVTVSDTKGRLLSDTEGGAGSGRLEAEQAIEDAAVTRADTMLASVLGPGRAVVRVNAELDTAERSRESETYDPERTAVLRSQKSKEDYDADGVAIGGVVSVPEPGEDGVGENGQSRYVKDEANEEYGVSRTVDRVLEAPGALKRVSVAVMVDENAVGLPPDAVISELVSNAVGVDADRGDTITVAAVPFAEPDEPEVVVPARDWTSLAGTGAAVLLLLGIGVAFLRAVRRGRVDEVPLAELEADDEPPALPAAPAATAIAPAPAPDRASEVAVLELVDSRPDEVTALIRSWLSEPAESGKR